MRDSILNVRSSGLGNVQRHVRRSVSKIKHHKPKDIYIGSKSKAEANKKVKQTIHRRKVSARTKNELKQYNKWGDRIS